MDELTSAEKIQIVINTLRTLEIPPTFDNVNRLTGIYNILFELQRTPEKEAAEDEQTDAG